MDNMNMQEASRVILGLRAAGWDEKDINDFILYIETGDEQYKPKEKPTKQALGIDREGGTCRRSPSRRIIAI